ncbi:MAG: flagellar export protein FliJ [Planctomycetes bacterium]|nr:flagellar export protein FliJ [Planctomycetota bacterium]MBI3835302.1 flagellar export protein FliJ [Planctomycetota bacterium]
MAKRFQFRLEAVRRIREQAKDARLRDLAGAVRQFSASKHVLESLGDQLSESTDELRGSKKLGLLDLSALRAQQYFGVWLEWQIRDASADVQEKRKAVDAERKKLADANAQFKAIEKLRERAIARHALQNRREEQMEMDEIAGRKWGTDREFRLSR